MSNDLRKYAISAGFPAWMLERYVEKILQAGVSLAILETIGQGRFVMDRHVAMFYRFGGLS